MTRAVTAEEFVALLGAVNALESLAEDQPEIYGRDADLVDQVRVKIWVSMSPTQRRRVHELTGVRP